MILPRLRAPALLVVVPAVVLAAHCGGSPFEAGQGADASTGDGSVRGDATGSSSGSSSGGSSSGGQDGPSCTPTTGNQSCDACIAGSCDAEWCKCAGDPSLHNGVPGCLAYVACVDTCVAGGRTGADCATRCTPGFTSGERDDGDALLACTESHCLVACTGTTSSSGSGGSSSSSGGSSSSSGGSSSTSGGSSSSSGGSSSTSGSSGSGGSSGGGSSSSSGGSGSSSGVAKDATSVCTCPTCMTGDVCCALPTSPQCGQCYNLGCGACCMP